MIKAQGKVKQRSNFKALLYFHIVIRTLITMKGGTILALVLFAFITIGDVDALKCYKCDGKSQDDILNTVCQGEEDLGKLVDCTGHCQKMIQQKTGEVFLTNSLLISTGFLKYPFRHSFQTGIKIQ